MVKEYKDLLFVEADNFENAEIHNGILYYLQTGGQSIRSRLHLPPGSWHIIGKGDEIDWEWVVEASDPFEDGDNNWIRYFKNYNHLANRFKAIGFVESATESGHSLLRSLGMEPGTTLILKKIKP